MRQKDSDQAVRDPEERHHDSDISEKDERIMDNLNNFVLIDAPCGYRDKDNGRMYYPDVNCDFHCEACGWNPAEQKRRLREGRMKPVKGRRKLRHLVFKRKEKADVQLERQDH